jgi:hypothetical protein
VRTACVLTVLCSGCSSAPVKEPAPAPAPVAAFDGVDVTVLRPDPWAGFQPATMKIDPRELTGEYSLSAGVPGSIELRLLDRGVFFESFAGCIPCVKYTFGTWQLDESGVILHPEVGRDDRQRDQEVRLIPVLLRGEIDLVAAEEEAAFSAAGPTLANHFRRRAESSYWRELLERRALRDRE